MPKEAINLKELLGKIKHGEIVEDKAILEYKDDSYRRFPVFQNSGLNILLGNEGNGKTKFLTQLIFMILNFKKSNKSASLNRKVLYIDTERPESQYAFSIEYIFKNTLMEEKSTIENLHFLSVMELNVRSIKETVDSHLKKNQHENFIIIIDHILPLVNDMNNTNEATEIDQFLKAMIAKGHIIIASIHKPYNGLAKGLGHLGSALQRLASFILEITNSIEGDGFTIKIIKSRISAKTENILFFPKDEHGNIQPNCKPIFKSKPTKAEKENNSEIAKELLKEFIEGEQKTKKQLLSNIIKRMEYTEKSSSANSFYNDYLRPLIEFDKGELLITEDGNKIINHESE